MFKSLASRFVTFLKSFIGDQTHWAHKDFNEMSDEEREEIDRFCI